MPTAFYAVGIVYMIARPNFGSALDSGAVLYYNIGKRRILLSRRFL